jgi:hypothetical protein
VKNIIGAAAIAGCLGALLVPGVASAKPGDHSLQQTYPIASQLCIKATSNSLPKGIAGDSSQVTGYCTTLQSSYNAAVNTAQTAEQTFQSGVASARSTTASACQPAPTTTAGRKACRQARRQLRHTLMSLRTSWRLAVRQYHVSIEQGRVTFWTAIHELRGGANITPDQPQPNAPVPSTT